MAVTLADIEAARRVIASSTLRTPCLPSSRLSTLTGADICVKYENLQATGSFKERGAINKLASLTDAEKRRGVVAMSAGNHAQAVAYHATRMGIASTIVMPEPTPYVKVAATEGHGARVVLHGESVSDAEERAMRFVADDGLVLVHPYDDEKVIAGQGTIGLELLEDAPDLDVLVVPIGGGGLISGIATAAKALKPNIEIIGVEALLYPSMANAVQSKQRPVGGTTIAEGIAVKNVGKLTLPTVKKLVSEILLADEAALERAVNTFLTLQKTMAEGAGAAGLAAVLAEPARFKGRRVGLVLCGGNIDPRVAASIMVRELERDDRIVSYRIAIQDRPGMLGLISSLLGKLGANILEVHHRRLFLDMPARGARLDVTVETRDRAHAMSIERALKAEGYAVERIDTGAGGFEPI
ncbi:MAG TPA: threonine ammonia-lyase [Xanthobacteraceae bacterium]|nr:threonine ammonia-lyase [Xanthobacteraceae bacterium]